MFQETEFMTYPNLYKAPKAVFLALRYLVSKPVAVDARVLMPPSKAKSSYDWDYFEFPKCITPEMVPNGNNLHEFVMVVRFVPLSSCHRSHFALQKNDFGVPSVINTKINGINAYATSDLLMPHPTKPGLWKIFGRADDQIIHNTGEKVSSSIYLLRVLKFGRTIADEPCTAGYMFPTYMYTNADGVCVSTESMLNQDHHVSAAVMFGRGQFQAGVLVEPKPQFALDPADETKLANFRNLIW